MTQSNIKILSEEKEKKIILVLEPRLYPIDIIYTTSYTYLDSAYIFLKGNPKKEIILEIEPKNHMENKELKAFGKEFMNQLINYGHHLHMSEKNLDVKKSILQEIFMHNSIETENDALDDEIDDPEGILVPWEEKYGKDKKD